MLPNTSFHQKFIMKKISSLAVWVHYYALPVVHQKKEEERKEQVTFLVTSPLKKDTIVLSNYVCQIKAIQHIELRAL